MVRKIHKHGDSDIKRIVRILELNLELWTETQKLWHAVHGKKRRAGKPPHTEAKHMANLDDAISQLQSTVTDSLAAQDAAITALAAGPVTPAQVQAITEATAAIAAKAQQLKDATPVP